MVVVVMMMKEEMITGLECALSDSFGDKVKEGYNKYQRWFPSFLNETWGDGSTLYEDEKKL